MPHDIFEQSPTHSGETAQNPREVKREALDTLRAVLLAVEHEGRLPEHGVSYRLPALDADPEQNLKLYADVLDEIVNDGPDKPFDLMRGGREFIEGERWNGKSYKIVNTELIGRSFPIALSEVSEVDESGRPQSYVPILRVGGHPLLSRNLLDTQLQ